ncbi:unnamed protein product, partial [Vitis vinifera]|uniref:Uncharacterized protein n=1 Tax=Vitis vinifera TaxID=29760 RepID=D7T2E9_VITVI
MEFGIKQGQAPALGQLGQGHGPLKRTGTVTFLVSLSVWKSRHETHREDDPVFDWGWNGWADRKQSVPFIHLYFISRKGNLHIPWQHCQAH